MAGARVLVILGGFFIALIWVSLFMVPNSSPRAFEGVRSPLQRFSSKGPLLAGNFFYFSPEGARERTHGCSPRAFWRNGVYYFKGFYP